MVVRVSTERWVRMNDIAEGICCFILISIVAMLFLWLRYLQADKNIYCVFDASPRTCAVLMKNKQ